MKKLMMTLVLLPLMALADAVTLKNIGVADASAPVELGQWHGGFEKCLEKADREHIPMLAIWGMRAARVGNGYLRGCDGYQWAGRGLNAYSFVAQYWNKGDGKLA